MIITIFHETVILADRGRTVGFRWVVILFSVGDDMGKYRRYRQAKFRSFMITGVCTLCDLFDWD